MQHIQLVTAFSEYDTAHRIACFEKLLREIIARGLPLYVSYKGPAIEQWRATYAGSGVTFGEQQSIRGIGDAVAEAMSSAAILSKANYLVWTEPQKVDLARCISEHCEAFDGDTPLILFNRVSYTNYPLSQKAHYLLLRKLFCARYGRDVDIGFGPFGIRREHVADFFDTSFRKWSRFICPRTTFITNDQARIVEVDFTNHWDMFVHERHSLRYAYKRMKQLYWISRDLFGKTRVRTYCKTTNML